MSQVQECIAEMRCFVRGGLPGIEMLKRVYKNIFLHYEIFFPEDKRLIIASLGLGHNFQRFFFESQEQPSLPCQKKATKRSGVRPHGVSMFMASHGEEEVEYGGSEESVL
jgi:hypothetical protein